MYKLLLSTTLFFSTLFLIGLFSPTHAACPSAINLDHVTITQNDSCTIPAGYTYYIDKADTVVSTTNSGQLSLTGGSLTISNTASLVTGSIVPSGGAIIIQNGGSIKVGGSNSVAYVDDVDQDGYTPSLSTIYTSSGAGRRRLALMNSTTLTDCYDNNANARPGSTTCSSSHRGDGSFDYNCSSTSTKCGTNYNRSASSQFDDACKSNRCQPVYLSSYIIATINCGQTGYICTSTGYACLDCDVIDGICDCTTGTSFCNAASGGTQACQ